MAYANVETWKPYTKQAAILDRAMEHIQSVPYKVSARWVFYRLLQEGYYNEKKDYRNFISLTSRARHAFYNSWHPMTLADDTRKMVKYSTFGNRPEPDIEAIVTEGKSDAEEELERAKDAYKNYRYVYSYSVDPKYYQDYILLIMFEARAMSQQFETYTHGITLCPFGGQPSIPYKYSIARYIESEYQDYRKDVVVLYFGDLDDAGLQIFESGRDDIQKWCNVPIHFIRCGLNDEHVERFGVPENFEHPGYQWEALTDPQAREIINEGLEPYHRPDAEDLALEEEHRIEETVGMAVNEYVDRIRTEEE
jgi:hypothetical protein